MKLIFRRSRSVLSNLGYLPNKRKERTIITGINLNSSPLHPAIVVCSGHGAVQETPMTQVSIRPTVFDRHDLNLAQTSYLQLDCSPRAFFCAYKYRTTRSCDMKFCARVYRWLYSRYACLVVTSIYQKYPDPRRPSSIASRCGVN